VSRDHVPELGYAALLEEDAADLYENAPCGYFSATDEGVIVKANATFLAMTGYRRERLVGHMRLFDLLTIGSRILFETHLRPMLRLQGFLREIAADLIRADGRYIPVLLNATEKRSPTSSTAVLRVTVIDATERRMYERELLLARQRAEDAARARTDLINMVSHDVRAPLGAVLTAVALLEKSALSPPQQRYAGIIRSSVTQTVTLLNSILALGALEGGRAALRVTPFNLRQLVEEMRAHAALAAAHKPGLAVRAVVDEPVPDWIAADRPKLAQVLTNLLTNAVKFTERGVVSLVVYARELTVETVTLEWVVSDTGIGIPADRLPHIFDEFTQASDDTAVTYGGSGLGLAITRKLLLLFGSDLRVTSTVGQGSTFAFTVQVPRAEQAAEDPGAGSPP
jgi:PAS domain S-box-containing protein